MFNAALLAFAAARWSRSLAAAAALGVLAAATPVLVALVQDPMEVAVGIWVVAIVFIWAVGRAVARQERLVVELEGTRRQLAQHALLAERRRIARDVHDFVGHGLAAVMLQVTSARHVLRRDADAAEEALRSAEEVGRRSMRELRRTVTLLRSDDEAGVAAPVPTASEIPALVDEARAGVSPSSCTREEISRESRPAWASRSTGSRRRHWRTPLAMPRMRGRRSGSSSRMDESSSWRRRAALSPPDRPLSEIDPITG